MACNTHRSNLTLTADSLPPAGVGFRSVAAPSQIMTKSLRETKTLRSKRVIAAGLAELQGRDTGDCFREA